MKKKLEDLKALCDELNKQLDESNYKTSRLERDHVNISAKYNELRSQASTTVTLAEDAQMYREEFNHVADLLISCSEYTNFPSKFPTSTHLR